MVILCSKCGSRFQMPVEMQSGACPSCGQVVDLSGIAGATCPICCSSFENEDEIRQCPHCQTWHHVECWDDNHGCSTYGCPSSSCQDVHADDASAALAEDGGAPSLCPNCHQEIAPTDVVCPHCGMLTSVPLKAGAIDGMGNPRRILRNLKLFFKDFVGIFSKFIPSFLKSYGDAFAKFAVFKGRTSRPDFVRFCIVTFILLWLLEQFRNSAVLLIIFGVIQIIPTLAIVVRRLRDTDISPWYFFLFPLLPFLLLVPTVLPEGDKKSKENSLDIEVRK